MVLNLTKTGEDRTQFNVVNFPDGQRMLGIFADVAHANDNVITIASRFSWADLELISQAVAYFREKYPRKEIHLYLPYFLGARADRKFDEKSVHYLKHVTAKAINDLKADKVYVLTPHSDVLEGCVNNLCKIDDHFIADRAITSIYGLDYLHECSIYYISPDAGATKRVIKIVEKLLDDPDKIIQCGKVRDESTGKLTKAWVSKDDLEGRDCWILDDICSYGGTFKALAQELKKKNAGKIYLVVSHYEGVADEASLKEAGIEKVFTTNSIDFLYDPEFIVAYEMFNIQ